MGRGQPRKIKSPEEMEALWEEYKEWCDNQTVLTHEFSQKFGEFVSQPLKKKITYTVEGFCLRKLKLARSAFYATYCNDPDYEDIVSRIEAECGLDAREKFETGQIPTQLAGLWMSKHGYTTKTDAELKADVTSQGTATQVIKFEGVLDEWSQ